MEPEDQEKEIEMEQEPIKVYKGGSVNSVNGKTGDVVLTTSDLENDSDYQTGDEVDSAIDSAIGELNIPTKTSELENDGEDGSSVYIEADELASVATSGSYNDLDNKPTIPAAQVNSDWNADSGVAQILNKPTIPTVNDATLTITQNGTSKGTFTANDSDDTTIEVSDTTYTAGTGIDITNGVISATGGGGPTVVQTTGTSTTDVMSQNATSSMVFADPGTNSKIKIGSNTRADSDLSVVVGRSATDSGSYYNTIIGSNGIVSAGRNACVGIGFQTSVNADNSVAIGRAAKISQTSHQSSVALGAWAEPTRKGEVNIGAGTSGEGYNSTNYRVLGGVHDPVNAHDAATKGYVDSQGGGGVTPVQTTGTSTTDVMSQNATSSMVYADPGTDTKIKIGSGSSEPGTQGILIGNGAYNNNSTSRNISIGVSAHCQDTYDCIALGSQASAQSHSSIAIGRTAKVNQNLAGSIALGAYSTATRTGEVNVGTSWNATGYNNTAYRVIGGVHDPVDAHDAATKGYVDAHSGGGGGGAVKLTTADYNYDTNGGTNYNAIALWLLDDDLYQMPDSSVNVVGAASGSYYDRFNNAITGRKFLYFYKSANKFWFIADPSDVDNNIFTGAPLYYCTIRTSDGRFYVSKDYQLVRQDQLPTS